MKKIIYFLAFILACVACKKEMPKPIVTDPDPPLVITQDTTCTECINCKEGDGITGPICLWRNKIINNNDLSGNDKPFIYKDLVIFTRNQNSHIPEVILFYHKKTGKKLAEWEDYASGAPDALSFKSFYAYGNTLMVGTGTRVYAIDLTTFKTKWFTKSHNFGDWEVGGIGNTTFHYTSNESQKTIYLEKGATNNTKLETIYEETVPDNTKITFWHYYPYIEQKDTMLLFWTGKYNYETYVVSWYLNAYNVTQKKMVYQEKINEFGTDNNFPAPPMVKDNKMYVSLGNGLYCIDIKTGKDLWRKKLPNKNTHEAILGDDGNVYVSSQAFPSAIFHCFDANNGNELWTTLIDDSCQNMVYCNGVVYTVGQGSTKINAIDTKNRKLLWKYWCSETKGGNSSIMFLPYITLDKSTNKLYIGSNTSAYCLQTVQ